MAVIPGPWQSRAVDQRMAESFMRVWPSLEYLPDAWISTLFAGFGITPRMLMQVRDALQRESNRRRSPR